MATRTLRPPPLRGQRPPGAVTVRPRLRSPAAPARSKEQSEQSVPGSHARRVTPIKQETIGGKLDLDIEEEETEFLFLDHKTVYIALCCQLISTALIVLILSTIPDVKRALRRRVRIFRPDLFICAVIICFSIWIYCISKTLRIKKPWNFIIMGFFTVALSYCMAAFCTRYINIEIFGGVVMAAICCGIAVLMVYYELVDLLPHLEVILVMVLGLIVVETIHTFFWNVNVLEVFFGLIHLILFISFLIYTIQLEQTQSVLYAYPGDEYVGATLLIYLAVVYLFFRSWLFVHAVNQLLSNPFT